MRRAWVHGLVTMWVLGSCGGAAPPDLASSVATCVEGAHDMSCPRPIFNVDDLGLSQRYYVDALGFRLDWEYGDPPDFASVSRGDATLFLCQRCQGTPGAWMMIFVRDVDALYATFVERGARIRMPPQNMPWNVREAHVLDPSGNVIRFGGPVRSGNDGT